MEDKFKFLNSKPLQKEKGVIFDDGKNSNTEIKQEIENNLTFIPVKKIYDRNIYNIIQ